MSESGTTPVRTALLSPRFVALMVALVLPGIVPFVAPYLPFQDWPAHLGIVGALAHKGDPAAQFDKFYTFETWLKPNIMFYGLAHITAKVLDPFFAARFWLAVSLAAVGPAMYRLCRAADVDPRVALLALPMALGRHVYCGFVSNSFGLVFFILSFAAYFELRKKACIKNAVLLAVWLFCTLISHSFIYLATAGLILLAIAIDLVKAPRRPAFFGLGATVLSTLGFLPHFLRMGQRTGKGPGFVEAVWTASMGADRSKLATTLWQWLFASYRYSNVDDVMQGIWVGLFVVLILAAVVVKKRANEAVVVTPHVQLLVCALVVFGMFAFLPSYIGPPLNWWGGNLRLPPMAIFLLVPLAGAALGNSTFGSAVYGVLGAFCVTCVLMATVDLYRFSSGEMNGFAKVLSKVPKGQRLSLVHYTPKPVHEYPGEPHGYASNYYLLQGGGLVPQNIFEHADNLVHRKFSVPAPPWGIASAFRWPGHGWQFDAFIVRKHATRLDWPFIGPAAEAVELVADAGNWRYYRRRRPGDKAEGALQKTEQRRLKTKGPVVKTEGLGAPSP